MQTLEEANIKLASVITDVMGLSGRRMIEAIIAGETNPMRLAALAHRRIKSKRRGICWSKRSVAG
jgi:transposase